MRPQRWQPTRLPHPWDSPGKNTGVVAISFSNAGKWKVKVKSLSCVRLPATPWTAPTRLLRPWDFPGTSTGVGCHCLLQYTKKLFMIKFLWHTVLVIFITQYWNHCYIYQWWEADVQFLELWERKPYCMVIYFWKQNYKTVRKLSINFILDITHLIPM